MSQPFQTLVQLAFNYSLDMVAWSAALAAFSVQVMGDRPRGWPGKLTIAGILVLCLLAVLSGMMCLSLIVGLFDTQADEAAMTALPDDVLDWAQVQFIAFILALLLNIGFGLIRMLRRPL